MDRPLILVTNDDGITAPGIRALLDFVQELGEVVVVAPDRGQSGMGHAITVGNIVRLSPMNHSEHLEFSCTGTPVDCVKLAITHALDGRRPDLVVSGINHGSNNSINVIYSGTMSAALEAAMEGLPSIGFSHASYDYNQDFSSLKPFIQKLCRNALSGPFPKHTCLNVNFPDIPGEQVKGMKVCRQAEAHWSDSFEKRIDPAGNAYFWLKGVFEGKDKGMDTDVWALDNGYISVVPVQYDLTAHHAMGDFNAWDYEI